MTILATDLISTQMPRGYTGSQGVGYTGSQGVIGYTGSQSTAVTFFTFGGTGTPSTGTDMTPWIRIMASTTCVNASLVAKTAPAGGSFVVSILRSSDGGATFPTTVVTLTLTTGNKVVTANTTTSLSAGDLLRLDITSVNAAANWSAQLYTN